MAERHSPKPVSGGDKGFTHHSFSVGMLLRGGQRQYVWKAMSHSSQRSCLSGSCLPPHRWQAHTRQILLWSSLQCLQEGPLFPGHGSQGQHGQGRPNKGQEPPPHDQRGRHRRVGSGLTSHRVFNHGAPLAWALNLEDFIHKDDATVIERIIPVRNKPLEHSGWPALLRPLRGDLAT